MGIFLCIGLNVCTNVLCTQSNRLMGTVSLSAHYMYLRYLSTIKEKLALRLNFSRTLV